MIVVPVTMPAAAASKTFEEAMPEKLQTKIERNVALAAKVAVTVVAPLLLFCT